MNVISRGIRNAFRNVIRTISIIFILGLSLGLSLTMLIAHQAVGQKIASVKASVGNTVSISPAGSRGFEGGGTALTETQLADITKIPHVTALTETLSDRLTTSDTNLQSAVSAGSLGRRFSQNNGQSFQFNPGQGGGRDGITGSGPTSSGTVTTNFTPPITVNGTNNPADTSASDTFGGSSFSLKSGQLFNGTSTANIALVGSNLASKNNLKVGSTFTAYNTTITVVGIYDAGNTFSDNQIIMPLATVQKLSSQSGAVTSATATVDSITNVSSVTSAVSKQLGSAADVTNAAQTAQNSIAPLQNIQTISLYSLIGAVIAGSVIILLTMIMIVRERRREIGVIKAIGASNLKVVSQFMVEAVTFTILAAIIGIILGVIAGNPITKLLVNNSTSSSSTGAAMAGPGGGMDRGLRFINHNLTNIHATVGWGIIVDGLLAAIIIAVTGSALASFFIAKIRPMEVMRVE